MSRHQMPRPHLLVRVLLAVTLNRPRVEVTRSALMVTLGWSFRVAVPLGAIDSVAALPWRALSIGAHGWRGRWLVNTATGPLVRVILDRPTPGRVLGVPVQIRELTLSVADVDAFLTDVR